MFLYLSATSPYARKIHITLLEKGLPFSPVYVTPADPAVAAANPLGKIPYLVRAEGRPLYDSSVIFQYLELTHPTPALLPTEPLLRIEALQWEALCDGICDATVAILTESRRDPAKQDPAARVHQEKKVLRGLARAEVDVGDHPYAVGNSFGLADIAIEVMIGYVELRAPALLKDFAGLQARHAAGAARPSFAATVPKTP
jgi:glutathione S-transferase